jgi:PrtD family type I secretion system ABC transporter
MSSTPPRLSENKSCSELAGALAACRGAFVGTALISVMSNVLTLTGSFFMLEVYDRVVPSRSIPTLIGLCVIAAFLYMTQGALDAMRGRILARAGCKLDESLSGRIYDLLVRLSLQTGSRTDGAQPSRDLDNLRGYLSGLGPVALLDLPWLPLYLMICYLFHPLLGITALVGAVVLVALMLLVEVFMRAPAQAVTRHAVARNKIAEVSRRNAEALTAMGMGDRMAGRWSEANSKLMAAQCEMSDIAGGFGALSRTLRMMLQSGVLAVGAYLVIHQEATGGIIIAGSILSARALAPVDQVIAHWKGMNAARQSWHRLSKLLALLPVRAPALPLQAPEKFLAVENMSVAPPGETKLVVRDVSFRLDAGQGLGIIGRSGSGKSSLARSLVGVWGPARGNVRIDGAAIDQWSSAALGQHIGYLPQNIELLDGTVAQNIARFELDPDPEEIIAAAKMAGVHDLILRLPNGYETEIGEQGSSLSAGQAQRVAMARALYRDPFLVVLDEPNSNLDAEGEQALTVAIRRIRARGGIVIVIAHRPSAIAAVDLVLMMNEGCAQAFGPKEEVLAKVVLQQPLPPSLKKVPEAAGAA